MPVLILGETGTGKDLIAQGLHRLSGCAGRYVPINCAAAHRELFGADLFGARRGAYTGAAENRAGLIQEAEGGTLFLDEIADLDPGAQGLLLRFLDSGEIRPLGETRCIQIRTRVVSATCRDLEQLLADNTLRRDLYARLAAAVVRLPALRERLADLEALARMLWARHGGSSMDFKRVVTSEVLEAMSHCPWPGNVRDLRHAIVRAALFAKEGSTQLARRHLIAGHGGGECQCWNNPRSDPLKGQDRPVEQVARHEDATAWVRALPPLERHSAATFDRALRESNGRVAAAARVLGISRSHAYRLRKRLKT